MSGWLRRCLSVSVPHNYPRNREIYYVACIISDHSSAWAPVASIKRKSCSLESLWIVGCGLYLVTEDPDEFLCWLLEWLPAAGSPGCKQLIIVSHHMKYPWYLLISPAHGYDRVSIIITHETCSGGTSLEQSVYRLVG